jgi:hypothetical protein
LVVARQNQTRLLRCYFYISQSIKADFRQKYNIYIDKVTMNFNFFIVLSLTQKNVHIN